MLILLISLLAGSAMSLAAQESEAEYEPYRDSEFPGWALKLRRAEVLFFGSLPFTLLLSNVGFDLFTYVDNGFNAEYLPLFSPGSGGAPIDSEERVYRIAAALTGSLLIALIDNIIGDIQDDKRNR
jgi:hypothetical protein